jgi:hypothetical protein
MKKVIFLFLLSILFSCKKQEVFYANITQNPKLFFDGKSIIDKKRNDSIICDLNNKIALPKKYSFTEEFDLKSLLISNKILKINKIEVFKNRNQFSTYECLNLDTFLSKDKIIENPITYNIEYKNIKIKTLIVEYEFKTKKDLSNAYTIYYNYCTFLRNLRRDKYQFRCCELFDEMFYYTTIKGNKLYFISDLFNYTYSKPKYNIESDVFQNKDIIMDNVYKILDED